MIVTGVVLTASDAALLLPVLSDGVQRRRVRGDAIGVDVLALVDEVAALARAWRAAEAAEPAELPQRDDSDIQSDDVTTQEAGTLLGVTDRRVRQLIASGRLSAQRTGGAWHVQTSEVERYAGDRRRLRPTPRAANAG